MQTASAHIPHCGQENNHFSSLLQLADFGFSKEVEADQFLETYCGSSLYASPEMILGRPYFGTECDVWSLGVILYTMLTATMPFDDRNVPVFLRCIESGIYPDPSNVSESECIINRSRKFACLGNIMLSLYTFSWERRAKCIIVSFTLSYSGQRPSIKNAGSQPHIKSNH